MDHFDRTPSYLLLLHRFARSQLDFSSKVVWFPSCLVLVQADESVGFGGLRLNPGSQDPITVTDTTTVRIVPDTTEHHRALYVENTELWRMARGLTHPSSISPEIRWWNMTCARLGGVLVWRWRFNFFSLQFSIFYWCTECTKGLDQKHITGYEGVFTTKTLKYIVVIKYENTAG